MPKLQPGKQQTYDPEEIRKWKKLIYGTHMATTQVDEWVSSDQGASKTGRRKAKKTYGSSNNDSFSNSSSNDDWLSGPSTPKKSYRNKY